MLSRSDESPGRGGDWCMSRVDSGSMQISTLFNGVTYNTSAQALCAVQKVTQRCVTGKIKQRHGNGSAKTIVREKHRAYSKTGGP